ncbi:MAG: demethylmenaquinone methyltransferase / 2-methoxy-6-polyprenyl,4-benzoquinol methylase [Bacteroidota bacterium]|nr:demethylmenaquinone methyltransferase / 2-methoxy-6-polyprenyl,4-benzoquinol methylase [Bacteroidota bacterium]
MDHPSKTHFGYQTVDETEKQAKVNDVFTKVAHQYDIMNDVMSLGIHHYWKWLTIHTALIKKNSQVLDLACGSADLSRLICKKYYPNINLYLADINADMLNQGRTRLINMGFMENIQYFQVNAEALPFLSQYFETSIMAFGLRNVTHQQQALQELFRVTRPGGKICILEFSKPKLDVIKRFYDWYSFHVIPKMGQWIANDANSYQYLVESIRMHPDQETLKNMILKAGFDRCDVHNLTGGIVALHVAYRY